MLSRSSIERYFSYAVIKAEKQCVYRRGSIQGSHALVVSAQLMTTASVITTAALFPCRYDLYSTHTLQLQDDEREETKGSSSKRSTNSISESKRANGNRRAPPKRSQLTASASVATPEQLLELTVTVHTSCAEAFGASPLEFIGFLRAWHALHAGRRDALVKSSSDLRAGLGKLREAADTVDALSRR
jgi:hypothetical protein